MFFDPIIEIPYIALIGIFFFAISIYTYLSISSFLTFYKKSLLLALRLSAIGIIVFLLLQPSKNQKQKQQQIETIVVAIDTSRSMRQKDVEQTSRIDMAKSILLRSPLLKADPKKMSIKLYEFHQNAYPLSFKALADLSAQGNTSLFHTSIKEILAQPGNIKALVLLSDGHDWEGENPMKTALLARNYNTPIFAMALGGKGKVRDIAVNFVNYQSYVYVKQKFHIEGHIRAIGCEHEDLTVKLLREGEVVDVRTLNVGNKRETTVRFTREEAKVGQFEYEIVVLPLSEEVDKKNNSSTSFIQTIQQPIRVLLLEARPYWDTTFLQRTLLKNDKIDLEAFIQYSQGKTRRIRNRSKKSELKLPQNMAQFSQYDIVLLGKAIDELLHQKQLELLHDYAKKRGGNIIFTRGNAYKSASIKVNNLAPILWDVDGNDNIDLKTSRQGKGVSFTLLLEKFRKKENIPSPLVSYKALQRKNLAVSLADAADLDSDSQQNPGIVYRPYGRGRLVSLGVEGLWRWAFHEKVKPNDNLFLSFWEQMILWLIMNSDFMPGKEDTFKANTSNLILGEKIYFKYNLRVPKKDKLPKLKITDSKRKTTTITMHANKNFAGSFSCEFLPSKEGKYAAQLLDNKLKFIVYHDHPEEKEVAVDRDFLKTLCRGSGGKILKKLSLKNLPKSIQQRQKIKLIPIWDQIWVIYLICLLLAIDWYLRRKWGLC